MYHNFDGLIFDMDGTLIDSGQMHEIAWKHALQVFNIPVDNPTMRSLAGVPTYQTAEILLTKHQCNHEIAADAITHEKETKAQEIALDHVKPTRLLEVVKEFHGIKPMAVGTGATSEEAIMLLTACDMLDFFETIVGADHVDNPKPAPDTFLTCAQRLNVDPTRCVVFEDSQLGLEAARKANMHAVDVQTELEIMNDYFR